MNLVVFEISPCQATCTIACMVGLSTTPYQIIKLLPDWVNVIAEDNSVPQPPPPPPPPLYPKPKTAFS